ncbi:ABC transporter substrate-binding protein [Quadrisphaera granulorum]|uniref:ABC transporter substrate-binding protein n=1 Tax=Quadrisphaera granulorum TaxID=317664 RepID=UPI001B87F8C8|nr:sugar ABC transporter substrate-binding protein [Quadrisphaera granulorum]
MTNHPGRRTTSPTALAASLAALQPTRRAVLRSGLLVGLSGAAGCSIADDPATSSGTSAAATTVTVRIWDDTVQPGYEKSFSAFTQANPDISVAVELVPWASYWDRLPVDVAGGTLPDILWINSSNYDNYVEAGTFENISKALPDALAGFQQSVVQQFTRDGALWGVPQLSDAIALFVNTDLASAAGVDASDLVWNPAGTGDTLLPAAKALTTLGGARPQYGFNAAFDLQAIYYNFVGSNGGRWQADDASYVFGDDPKSVEAIQYVVDLINRHKVAPSAADTNANGDFSRDQFTQGNLALFQSGTYNLRNVADGLTAKWAVAPALTGPAGRVTVTNGIVAVANAKSPRREAALEVLRWLASPEGALFIGAEGAAFPAVTAAQQTYLDYWKQQGVDVSPFLDAAAGETIRAPFGRRAQIGGQAAQPFLREVIAGRLAVADGMRQAQDAANTAIAG